MYVYYLIGIILIILVVLLYRIQSNSTRYTEDHLQEDALDSVKEGMTDVIGSKFDKYQVKYYKEKHMKQVENSRIPEAEKFPSETEIRKKLNSVKTNTSQQVLANIKKDRENRTQMIKKLKEMNKKESMSGMSSHHGVLNTGSDTLNVPVARGMGIFAMKDIAPGTQPYGDRITDGLGAGAGKFLSEDVDIHHSISNTNKLVSTQGNGIVTDPKLNTRGGNRSGSQSEIQSDSQHTTSSTFSSSLLSKIGGIFGLSSGSGFGSGSSLREGLTSNTPYTPDDALIDLQTPEYYNKREIELRRLRDKRASQNADVIAKTTEISEDSKIEHCNALSGTPTREKLAPSYCGVCVNNNKYYYGSQTGPISGTCGSDELDKTKWAPDWETYIKITERERCAAVKSCGEMVGDAAHCAWCLTTNRAYAAIKVGNKYVAKYDEDKNLCDARDPITGASIGLLPQSRCGEFPCFGPNANTGPHVDACLNKLWIGAGASAGGTGAPSVHVQNKSMWNGMSWQNAFDSMKNMVNKANSSDYSVASQFYKLVYGSEPNVCDSTFANKVPLGCYQKLYRETGCNSKGKLFPSQSNVNSWPNQFVNDGNAQLIRTGQMSRTDFKNMVKKYRDDGNNNSLYWKDRRLGRNLCYGDGHLVKPEDIEVGTYVRYEFYSNAWKEQAYLKGVVVNIDSSRNATIFWMQVLNKNYGRPHRRSATRMYHTRWMGDNLGKRVAMYHYLGLRAGDIPPFNKNSNDNVPSKIPVKNLKYIDNENPVKDDDCVRGVCKIQSIIYVSYKGGHVYNIPKDKIDEVSYKVTNRIPNAKLCSREDIQYLVDIGAAYCACGWVKWGNGHNCIYPSNNKTSGGCGGKRVQVIGCGWYGPSWARRRAGAYFMVSYNPTQINEVLGKEGLRSRMVAIVGYNTYYTMKHLGPIAYTKKIQVKKVGCYRDAGYRALPRHLGSRMTYDQIKNRAIAWGYRYFGLQHRYGNGNNPYYNRFNRAEGWGGTDWNRAKRYGAVRGWTQKYGRYLHDLTHLHGTYATQRTNYNRNLYPASHAIDHNGRTFNHTLKSAGQWWQVRFPYDVYITGVHLKNREDCCRHRLGRMQLDILDSNGRSVYRYRNNNMHNGRDRHIRTSRGGPWHINGKWQYFDKNDIRKNGQPVKARYLRITMLNNDYLHLSNVEVRGYDPFYYSCGKIKNGRKVSDSGGGWSNYIYEVKRIFTLR